MSYCVNIKDVKPGKGIIVLSVLFHVTFILLHTTRRFGFSFKNVNGKPLIGLTVSDPCISHYLV